jgi:branched-chain amino acid aminotransferase
MDFSKIRGKLYLNGKYIKISQAKISVFTHSLHFSGAVFEGIRIYNGKSLFINDHIERLLNSAKLMHLNIIKKKNEIVKICDKIIKINNLYNGYIRPIIFRSTHSMSPDVKECHSILCIAGWEWKNLFDKKYIKISVAKLKKINNEIFPVAAKSAASYQSSIIEKIHSYKNGFDDSLFIDSKKYVEETTACNIFWIKNNIIYTPKIKNALDGITRRAIIKICKKNKLKIIVNNYKIEKLFNADNVFLTGTAAEIQIVEKIKKKNFSVKSPILDVLIKEYNKIKMSGIKSVKDIH